MSFSASMRLELVPRPSVVRLETDEFDEVAAAFVSWDQRFTQLQCGKFHGRLQFADLNGIQLFDAETNLAFHCQGSRMPSSFTFSPVTSTNAGSLWRGRTLEPGMMNVVRDNQQTNHRTCPEYRQTAIVVQEDLFHRVSSGLIGVEPEALFHPRHVPFLGPERCQSLCDRWRQSLNDLEAQNLIDGDSAAGDSASDLKLELVSDLVRALAARRTVDPCRSTTSRRRWVVAEATAYSQSRPTRPTSILDLCERTGVSERTLHYAFVEVTGLSPKDYLKTLRLNQVRRELRRIGPGRGHVEQVAKQWGFTRPGSFASDYRRLFGELPSQTLRERGSS